MEFLRPKFSPGTEKERLKANKFKYPVQCLPQRNVSGLKRGGEGGWGRGEAGGDLKGAESRMRLPALKFASQTSLKFTIYLVMCAHIHVGPGDGAQAMWLGGKCLYLW